MPDTFILFQWILYISIGAFALLQASWWFKVRHETLGKGFFSLNFRDELLWMLPSFFVLLLLVALAGSKDLRDQTYIRMHNPDMGQQVVTEWITGLKGMHGGRRKKHDAN